MSLGTTSFSNLYPSSVLDYYLSIGVYASLHPVNIQKIKSVLQGGAHQGEPLGL